MACLFDLNGCDWFIWVITGKPPAFNVCILLLIQNLSLLMHKCKANVLEFDSASGRLSHGIQHMFWFSSWWGRGYRTRRLLSSHAAICVSSFQGNRFGAKFWGLYPIKTSLHTKPAVTLRMELFLHTAALWNHLHTTRRLAWVFYSFKEKYNPIRVNRCLQA